MNRFRVCLTCLLLTLSASAQNWPGFRGSDNSGIADGQDLPVEWSLDGSRNLLWQTQIPGLAHSSPIVWGDRVYLTTAVSLEAPPETRIGAVSGGLLADDSTQRHSWRLLALDRNTGEILWERVVREGTPRTRRHVKTTHASATPATDGEHLVALFDSEGLFCFDMDGNLLWEKDLGLIDAGYVADPSLQWGPASSPILYRNLVIVQVDHNGDSFLAAYTLDSGKEVWRVTRDEKPAWSTPVIYHGDTAQLITNSANYFYSYNPSTGEEYWRFSNEDNQVIIPSPVLAGDRVVLTGGASRYTRPIQAFRLDAVGSPDTGSGDSGARRVWRVEHSSPYTPTPLVYQGLLYVVADNGILSVYDMKDGARVYRTRIAVGAEFSASPVASDDRIFFASEDGDVYVVRSGREYELLAANPMGEPLMATPAVSKGLLIIRGRSRLYAVARK